MTQEDPRAALIRIAQERRETLRSLSILLGRNSAYLQQYVARGTPRVLTERDSKLLASYLMVDEAVLSGRAIDPRTVIAIVRVPLLGVQASAGNGVMVDGEFQIGSYGFDKAWLREVCRSKPDNLSIIRVLGDSMAPTLTDGDDVLVDQVDATGRLRDGIYVLRRDDTLMVKRLALAPTSGTLTISSDNPAYPCWRDCPLDSVTILGRVVWAGRKFG